MSHRKKKAPKVPQRLDWADMAKGIGILLMAVGHSAIPPDCWGIWIYSFHMPLFFFLSFYFFSLRPGGVADTIRHKAFPILMPYLSYSLGMWLWNTLRALSSGAAVDLQPLLGILLQWPGTPWSGTAWFFMGLFVAECVFALAVRLTRERPLPLLAVTFGLAALAWIYACLGGPRLLWRADAAALLLPYLALGLLFRRHQEELARPFRRSGPYWALTLGLLAANLLLTAANARFGSTHIDYNLRLLNEPFTAYGAGICGVAFCLLLCRKLPPIRPLLTIGRESAAYYAVGWLGSNVAHYAVRAVWPVSGMPLLLVHLLGLWLVPLPFLYLLERRCPALLGKRAPMPAPVR